MGVLCGQATLQRRLDAVLKEMEELRGDYATGVVALLVTQGDSVPQKKAQAWAKEHLFGARSGSNAE